jgi:hypothetical protein
MIDPAREEERNVWGYIFPEDERCIIVPEDDGNDGDGGDELEIEREPEGEAPKDQPALASISFNRTFMPGSAGHDLERWLGSAKSDILIPGHAANLFTRKVEAG